MIRACAAIRFHKLTNVHLAHCQDQLVFRLYLPTGNVHLDTVYLAQLVGERRISNPIVVRVVEAYQDHLV